MNKKHKKDIKRRIDRTLANKACEYFLTGNEDCKGAFLYRLNQLGFHYDLGILRFEKKS